MNLVKDFVSDLRTEFSGYNASKLSRDVMAGLTVAAVALPLSLAFGAGCGASAAAGLISAIIAGLVTATASGGSFQISGPSGAMTAILLSLVARFGLTGLLVAGFLAGVFLLIAGALKVGRLVSFLPPPVVTGFVSGIALVIALGQVDHLFGVTSVGETALIKVLSYAKVGFSPNWAAAAIGGGAAAVMALWPRSWGAKLPGSLLAILLTTAASVALGLDVPVVGALPRTLLAEGRLTLSAFTLDSVAELALPALSICVLIMIESLLCGAVGMRMHGSRFDPDRELIAQGIGNLVIPFFGGIPATAALARTSVAVKSGLQTRLAVVIHALCLIACMFLLAPMISRVPLSALAGVLVVTAWRMNDWQGIRFIIKKKLKGPIAQFALTFIATAVFDLTVAIGIGMVISLVLLASRAARLEVSVSEVDPERLREEAVVFIRGHERLRVAYITGALIAGGLDKLHHALGGIEGDTLVLSMRGVPFADASGAQAMLEACEKLSGRGVNVLFAGVQPDAMAMFERVGLTAAIPREAFFPTARHALRYAADQLAAEE